MKNLFLYPILALLCASVTTACEKGGGNDGPDNGSGNEPDDTKFSITITAGTGGTATATIDGTEITKADGGEEITLTATPNDSYEFLRWSASSPSVSIVDKTLPTTTFVMPQGDVSISATFAQLKTGSAGDLTWTLPQNGTLTISGQGAMPDYSDSAPPWRDHRASIKAVVIEEGVTSIGGGAFLNHSILKSITIPESVTSIGGQAFSGCSLLSTITVPSGVTSIGERAFYSCEALTGIEVAAGNQNYSSDKGALLNKEKTLFIYYPTKGSETSYSIPEGVTGIEGHAFYGCSSLTNVVIPDSVTSIGGFAFTFCSSLASVKISENITSLESMVFINCISLNNIVIPAKVTSIGVNTFAGCPALTSVTVMGTTPPTITVSNNFAANGDTLYVPKGYLATYKGSVLGGAFTNVVELP